MPVLFGAPCVSAWIPLVEMEEEHGPVKFLSESHKNDNNLFQYIPSNHPQLVRDGERALAGIEANQYFDPAKDIIQMGSYLHMTVRVYLNNLPCMLHKFLAP